MYPATPTALPPVMSVPIQLPGISLWDSTSQAITIWQMFGGATAALQIGLIVIIIAIFAWLAVSWMKSISSSRQS